MTIFLAIVAVITGFIGTIYLLAGPAFIGPIWWILSLVSLVGIGVLNYLGRLTRASEQLSGELIGQASIRSKFPPPSP